MSKLMARKKFSYFVRYVTIKKNEIFYKKIATKYSIDSIIINLLIQIIVTCYECEKKYEECSLSGNKSMEYSIYNNFFIVTLYFCCYNLT